MIGELMTQSMPNPQTVLLINQLGYSTPHLLNFQDCRSPKLMTFFKVKRTFSRRSTKSVRLKNELSYFASSFVNEFCSRVCPFK